MRSILYGNCYKCTSGGYFIEEKNSSCFAINSCEWMWVSLSKREQLWDPDTAVVNGCMFH